MSFFAKISKGVSDLARVFCNELRLILHDGGVLLFFIVLPLAYPIVYTLIYNTEVVRELPVAVVDNSCSPESRDFVRRADTSPSIEIYDYCPNMSDAKKLMAEGKVYGIIKIPGDYAKSMGRGEQAHVEFYSDMSLLLRYRTFAAALTELQLEVISEITADRVAMAGGEAVVGDEAGLPIESHSYFLGDSEQGFASFVIPGIVILILQQSLILGIAMLGGTSRERRRRNGGIDPEEVRGAGAWATVWGKTLCYTLIYIPLSLYILHLVPLIFNFPHYGTPLEYIVFVLPMLLATAFLGQSLNIAMKERESAFILVVFTSAIFMFLSGLTWPRYAMSALWKVAGAFIPAVWGVDGFVRINSNAASLGEVAGDYYALWILTFVYMLIACLVTRYLAVKHRSGEAKHPAQ